MKKMILPQYISNSRGWSLVTAIFLLASLFDGETAITVQPPNVASTNTSGVGRNSVLSCPGQYIDALAQCPDSLSCVTNDDCTAPHLCCSNICGTRTCVLPWQMQQRNFGEHLLCRGVLCPGQGKQCKVEGGEPTCQCVDKCGPPTTNEDFVCASDGYTYFTRCFMDMAACKSESTITRTTCTSVPTPNTNLRTSSEFGNLNSDELQAPVVLHVPDMTRAEEKSTVIFSCEVAGNPQPAIFWQKQDDAIFMAPGDFSERASVSADTGDLRIEDVRPEDNGEYTCHAANRRGVASVKFRLSVKPLKPVVPSRDGRSSKVECQTSPREQSPRCSVAESQMKIKRLWVYSRNSKKCRRVYFRDCSAVTNKFATWTDCANACMDICKLPPVKGSCRQFVQRIFFNPSTRRCQPFVYSGCHGNSNNFPNVRACEARCPSGRIRERKPTEMSPTTPETPLCAPCYMQEVQAVCRSEFAVVGIVKNVRLDVLKGINLNGHSRYIQVQLSEVMHDTSTLHLHDMDLVDPLQAKMKIFLKVDSACPCPDVRDILSGRPRDFQGNPEAAQSADTTSRRISTHRQNVKLIIVARSVDGHATLDSSGFIAEYSDVTYSRIKSALKPGICETLRMVEMQFLQP